MKINKQILQFWVDGTDYTKKAYRLGVDPFTFTLAGSTHITIGYEKPLTQWYFEVKTGNTNTNEFKMQTWNGTTWVDLETWDETNGLKNSGFVFVDAHENKAQDLHGKELYWYRFHNSGSTSAIELYGCNLIFCNLEDLRIEEPAIEEMYPKQIDSHILSMVAARDKILEIINASGRFMYRWDDTNALNATKGRGIWYAENFTQFDFFNVTEVRKAAVLYTLHKIYFNLSDSPSTQDEYYKKSMDYLKRFEAELNAFMGRKITLDLDNNGVEDDIEKAVSNIQIQLYR